MSKVQIRCGKASLEKRHEKPHQTPRGSKKPPKGLKYPKMCFKKMYGILFPISYNVGLENPYTVNQKSLVVQNVLIKLDSSCFL